MSDPNAHCTILLVEDEPVLRDEMQFQMVQHGFTVEAFASAGALDQRLPFIASKIAVLDIGLEGEDGFSLCQRLRAGNPQMGIVFITARSFRQDRLAGLALGADAYLVKPIDVDELVLVLRNLVWKTLGSVAEDKPGSWKLAAHGWELTAPNGTAIGLTAREHRTLERLIQAGGEVVVKRELAMDIFGGAITNGEQRLEVLLSRLRGKIRAAGEFSMPIQSAHAAGYAFTAAARIG